jgi:RNA polymerase sigma-70 factor (ECF subfamily)
MRSDAAAARMGGSGEVRGAAAVAGFFSGRAHAARVALIDGAVGAVVVAGGQTRIAIGFTVAGNRIITIDAIAEPEGLRDLDVAILGG